MRRTRILLYLESLLAALSAVLCVLTFAYPDWIERAFDVDPDGGGGALEWVIALGALVAALGFGLAARREWRLAARECHPIRSSMHGSYEERSTDRVTSSAS